MISWLFRYNNLSHWCSPGKLSISLVSFTHQGSFKYPVLILLYNEVLGVTDKTIAMGLMPEVVVVSMCLECCMYVGIFWSSAGKHDRVSVTKLSSPLMYCIVKSYCLKNSCHLACHLDSLHCDMKFSSILWSVYTMKGLPNNLMCHFLSAWTIANSSFSCIE